MSTTWGSSVWGNNSWQSDNNTIIPSSNTVSVTVNSVDSYNLSGWGGQFWGSEEWGNLLDETVQVTGLTALQTFTGNETPTGEINSGWGRQGWNVQAWGIQGSLLASGQQINTAVQSVTVDAQIQIGWGGLYWGAGEWGELSSPEVQLTGQLINTTTDTVTIEANANVDVTGQQRSIVTGDETAGTSVLVNLNPLTQLDIDTDGVFGGELVVVEVSSPVNDEWGTEPWGQGFWGVGDGVTLFVGTDHIHIGDANVILTGTSATGSTGTLGQASIYEFPNPATATTFVNDAFGGEVVEVQVTTASTQPWGETAWGDGQWGQSVGTDIAQGGEEVAVPSVEVDVTGEELTSNTGNETVTGDANLTLTGLSLLDIQQGDEDAFTNVKVQVTGQEIGPFVIGDYAAGISIIVEPTGVTSTVSTGIMGINAWAVVDPGTAPTWTVVDIAA